MNLVMGTTSSLSDYNGECDFVLVDLTPEYAELVLSRMKAIVALAKSDARLHEAHYWDEHAAYFQSPRDENLEELLEPAHDTYVVMEEPLPERLFQRVECAHMVIHVCNGEAEVSWRASLKNVSVYIESNELPQSAIEAAAAGRTPVTT